LALEHRTDADNSHFHIFGARKRPVVEPFFNNRGRFDRANPGN